MGERKILGIAEIQGVQDLKVELVDIAEWGGAVPLRVLTGGEREDFGKKVSRAKGNIEELSKIARHLVVTCLCHEDGQRLFPHGKLDDGVKLLNAKNANAVEKLQDAALALTGLTEKSVEGLEGNSGEPPSAEPGSD